MKKVQKQLQSIFSELEQKIEARDILFEERSEKWQESEKGDLYQEKTSELQEAIDCLEDAIDNLTLFMQ